MAVVLRVREALKGYDVTMQNPPEGVTSALSALLHAASCLFGGLALLVLPVAVVFLKIHKENPTKVQSFLTLAVLTGISLGVVAYVTSAAAGLATLEFSRYDEEFE